MSTLAIENIEHTNGTSAITVNSSGVVKAPKIPMLKVGQSGNIALSGTSGKIPYNSFSSADVFGGEDNMNAFDTSTSTYTIPTGCSGLWYISAGLYSTSNNPNQLAVNVNGTREDALGSDNGASNMNQGSITKRLNEGDTIQIHAFYASAITSGGNKYHTWWQMNLIG
jgi:hypothetical protein